MSERWRNVSIKKCLGTILLAIIACAVAVIPFTFGGSDGLVFTFKKLQYVGDGSIKIAGEGSILTILNLIPKIPSSITDLVGDIYNYSTLVYFGILALDIVFSLLLIVTRFNFLRKIFRIFSIIFTIAFILIVILNLLYIAGIIYVLTEDFKNIGKNFVTAFKSTGFTTALGFVFFGIILARKQLRFFKKPAWANKKKYNAYIVYTQK